MNWYKFAAFCLLFLVGCSSETADPASRFKQDHSATVTPHGRIEMDSVRASQDGIDYKTSDGSTWKTKTRPGTDGSPVYDAPTRTNQ